MQVELLSLIQHAIGVGQVQMLQALRTQPESRQLSLLRLQISIEIVASLAV